MSKLQVKKSNFLVPLEESVSKSAQLLASYLVASLPKSKITDNHLPHLQFSYVELRKAINADGKERVNKVQDMIDLGVELQKCILFYEDNVSERTVSWLIGQERNKQTNIFTYTLHPGLRKYLLNLEKHFTRYNYLFRVCLNAHAMKLYEILKMYQYRGEVEMSIEEDLKPSLGLSGKYPKVYDFKRRVLNIAQQEIEKYTDIRFDYEVATKRGKTPLSFKFMISGNKPTDLPPTLLDKFKAEGGTIPEAPLSVSAGSQETDQEEYTLIYAVLEEWGGQKSKIATLIATYGKATMRYQINHLQRILKSGKKIENPFAWFAKALKEDYKDAAQDQQKQRRVVGEAKKKAVREQQNTKKELDTLEKEYHHKMKAQCDVLIKKHPELLGDTIALLKDVFMIRRAMQSGKTNTEIYNNVMTTWAVQAKIHETHPDHFKGLKAFYQPKIGNLKKALKEK